ncbi:MAG: hypothetical protein ACFE94_04755 [Candidatus Hodarchaeota archaeon]
MTLEEIEESLIDKAKEQENNYNWIEAVSGKKNRARNDYLFKAQDNDRVLSTLRINIDLFFSF